MRHTSKNLKKMNEDIITIGNRESSDIQMLWLHGYGANNWSFEPSMKLLNLKLDDRLYIVIPNAALEKDRRSWYPLPVEVDGVIKEDHIGIEAAKDSFCKTISSHLDTSKETIIGGFSQGAAFSMYLGLSDFINCSHIISICGYIPSADRIQIRSKDKRVYLSHGTKDTTIRIETHKKSLQYLKSNNLSFHEFLDDCGHTISKPMLDDLTNWLYQLTFER